MEFHYEIKKEDYIALNLHYLNSNALVQKSILVTRIASAVICLLIGTALMYFLKLSPLSMLVYGALALVCFFGTPYYMRRKVVKNAENVLKRANNDKLYGQKTMTLGEDGFRFHGEGEDQTYSYETVCRIATDTAHFYVFVDEYASLIIPFTAFQTEEDKKAFYQQITKCIEDDALKC